MPPSIPGFDAGGPVFLPLWVALIGFCAIWPLSVWRRDASLVDAAWGPGFAVQLLIAASVAAQLGARAGLLLALVCLWSARLGFVLLRRRWREGHEDGRYTSIRTSWGRGFWWKSFFIVFVLQAFLQWLVALGPISGVLAANQTLGGIAVFGAALAVGGLALETLADRELDRFKQTAPPGALLTTGLRAHVRHPNYLGEIIFWVGIGLVCLEGNAWMGLASPILITLFLLKVSGAPMLDERLGNTRPGYAAYKRSVPAFIPRLGPLSAL